MLIPELLLWGTVALRGKEVFLCTPPTPLVEGGSWGVKPLALWVSVLPQQRPGRP